MIKRLARSQHILDIQTNRRSGIQELFVREFSKKKKRDLGKEQEKSAFELEEYTRSVLLSCLITNEFSEHVIEWCEG